MRKRFSKLTWHYAISLIISCATGYCSKHHTQALVITDNESFTSLWRNFGPQYFFYFGHTGGFTSTNRLFRGMFGSCITQVCLNFRARTDGWTVFLQDFVLEIKIHGSIKIKKAPDHHTNTTMFDYCFDQCKEYFPMFLFLFWSAVVFLLGTLPWMPFLPSLFLTVEP